MIYRRLGRTGLKVSLLGLGSGGHDPFGQRSGVSESRIHRLVHRALELGINLFDTAPAYLESENILGRALKGVPRDCYVIMTKVALVLDEDRRMAAPQMLIDSVEGSLRRLRIPEIDVLLVAGYLQPEVYDGINTDLIPVLEKLKQQGKLRFLGSSEWSAQDGSHRWLSHALRTDVFDVAMVAYNLINQSADKEVFLQCRKRDIGVVNIFTVRNVFSRPTRLQEVLVDLLQKGLLAPNSLQIENPLGWLLGNGADSIPAAAYKFVISNSAVSSVLTGTIDVKELEDNVRAVNSGPLGSEKIERLRDLFGNIGEAIGN